MNVNYDFIPWTGEAPARMPIAAWTRGVPTKSAAWNQVSNLTKLPFIFRHVAVMPDMHAGIGATVGTVIATKGAIIPAAVGVDIGCGMMACQIDIDANDLPGKLAEIRHAIEQAVPHGRSHNGGPDDCGSWHDDDLEVPSIAEKSRIHGVELDSLQPLILKYPKLERAANRACYQLGTLGTGNHFIEVCLDERNKVWVMLHSGSRGIGNAIGQQFIELAKKDMERWFISLPDKDLAYIPTGSPMFEDYFNGLKWAQAYAALNRQVMMKATLKAVYSTLKRKTPPKVVGTAINCHHNYARWEHHFGENVIVTRKGAVNASEGTLGIIPGSMGAKSFIVRGKGNAASFHSCSHGAGRKMSRTKARGVFTVADHEHATEGVECRKDALVLDETPGAYKDIDAVMAAQADLVEVVHTLRQLVCIKG